MTPVLRVAGADDAEAVAWLHADSWRRHYRGAYSGSFLDGDVLADRRAVWSSRLATPAGARTILAEDGTVPVGFAHVVFGHDDRWGSLVDNLHVAAGRQRTGVGTALLAAAAGAVGKRAGAGPVYLWVLELNDGAQRFYRALGGVPVETAPVPPPGGVAGRLNGAPNRIRLVWPDAALLARGRAPGAAGPRDRSWAQQGTEHQ